MKGLIASARPADATLGHGTELVNRTILGAITKAFSHYPSDIAGPTLDGDDQELLGQVLGLLAQEDVIRLTGTSFALTKSGYEAIDQMVRSDHRLEENLKFGRLPAEESEVLSLVVAILRQHFHLKGSTGG